MKLFFASLLFSTAAGAAELNLNSGESAVVEANVRLTATCEGPQASQKLNPQVVCLDQGYSPSSCAPLAKGFNAAQTICLQKGYSPSSCAAL